MAQFGNEGVGWEGPGDLLEVLPPRVSKEGTPTTHPREVLVGGERKQFVLNQGGLGSGVSWRPQPAPEGTGKRTPSTRRSPPWTGPRIKDTQVFPIL